MTTIRHSMSGSASDCACACHRGAIVEHFVACCGAAVVDGHPAAHTFEARVAPWMLECFGPQVAKDMRERGDRLLEEVFELLQAHGYDASRVATLRDYVWSRPVGDPAQEAGGVMVTLAAFCLAAGLNMHAAGDAELARVWTTIDQIRAKQATKRGLHTPLPTPPPAVDGKTTIISGLTCGCCGSTASARYEGETFAESICNTGCAPLRISTDAHTAILEKIRRARAASDESAAEGAQ
jgi:hypothetical protein